MKISSIIVLVIIVPAIACMAYGCSGMLPIDDQTRLPPEVDRCVNPPPVRRDFQLNNRNHDVIAAILDSGVDYNHPRLLRNMHFDLDDSNEPAGIGWDFVGQDPWPAPYVGRLSTTIEDEMKVIEEIVEANPSLRPYLEKCRNVVQEYMTFARHGTAVADLVARGSPDIGLLIYRTLPPAMNLQVERSYRVEILSNIVDSTDHAVKNGAMIIVITSFFLFEKGKCDDFEDAVLLKKTFERIVRDNPNILFVVSAGNCSGLRFTGDKPDRVVLPAGVSADNLLVVGSLSLDGTVSSFSNIPEGDLNAVYALGENIDTIGPQRMICIPGEQMNAILFDLDSIRGEGYYQKIGDCLRFFMKQNTSATVSGTSFSAGIVANLCLKIWLEQPELAPPQIIRKLKALL